jgi:hypothetical protein
MNNVSFRLHTSNLRALAFFRMLGADMQLTDVRPSWADATDRGVDFDMVRVTLTPQLQSYLHCHSGVDVTGFLAYFRLASPRSKRDAARALRRNKAAWDALAMDLLVLLGLAQKAKA